MIKRGYETRRLNKLEDYNVFEQYICARIPKEIVTNIISLYIKSSWVALQVRLTLFVE